MFWRGWGHRNLVVGLAFGGASCRFWAHWNVFLRPGAHRFWEAVLGPLECVFEAFCFLLLTVGFLFL